MSRLLNLVYLFAVACWTTKGARILVVIPTPSISHQVSFRPLTQELARRGNEVVVITTDPAFPKGRAPANLTEIDVHDVSYEIWRKVLVTNNKGNQNAIVKQIEMNLHVILEVFEKQTAVPEVKDIIENNNYIFDLLLVEAWTRFALGFSHALKVPVLAMSSLGACYDNYDVVGAPSHPFLYFQTYNNHVSIWETFKINYNFYSIMNMYQKLEACENELTRKIIGEHTPDLSELQNNVGMLFLNIHPLWEGNLPVPPGVIHIGGIHQKPEKQLPHDLKHYLDSAVHGVIYLSFGTNVDTSLVPADKIQTIINVFSQLPYDVLWKWNQDELPGRTENIRISKWFPQSDLLRHPKVKLFITQGGLQSTDETITAGVPVIGIPMVDDQWYNTEKYEDLKIGKRIYLNDLNEELFRSAIRTVIEDKSYRLNVARLRALMYEQPTSALERAVWWTEHALRHGTLHLRAPAHKMGVVEYYELPLVLTALAVAVILILLGLLVLYKTVKLMLRFVRTYYRSNVARLRALMHEQPTSALERAVWRTEHALRHVARHLRAPAHNYELSLVLTVLAVAVIVILFGLLVLYKIVK